MCFRSISRYLKQRGYPYDIVKSDEFSLSRETLKAKRKDLKKQGFGNRQHATTSLTFQEEETLWSSGVMGDSTAVSLQRALWYLTTTLMGENISVMSGCFYLLYNNLGRASFIPNRLTSYCLYVYLSGTTGVEPRT